MGGAGASSTHGQEILAPRTPYLQQTYLRDTFVSRLSRSAARQRVIAPIPGMQRERAAWLCHALWRRAPRFALSGQSQIERSYTHEAAGTPHTTRRKTSTQCGEESRRWSGERACPRSQWQSIPHACSQLCWLGVIRATSQAFPWQVACVVVNAAHAAVHASAPLKG